MSMSTHVVGFKPPDDKWKKMKAIWDSCEEAEIEPPKAVSKFFEDTPPDESGVEIELEEHDCVSEYSDDCRNGFEIDVRKLPPDVTIIRFYNSY